MGDIFSKILKHLFIASLILSGLAYAQNKNRIDDMIKGYSALIGKATGPNYQLETDGVVILPASRGGARGFYVYDKGMVYFQKLPKQPNERNDAYNYYYLKLQVPGRRDMFISYSDRVNDSEKPGIATLKTPADGVDYQLAIPEESLDVPAVDELENELLKRIATVSSNYEEMVRHRQKVDIADYKNALKVFSNNEDPALKNLRKAAYDEDQKLNSTKASAKETEHTNNPSLIK